VRRHATENAVLMLWSTSPKLPEALRVLEAWGFRYVTQAVWDKRRMGAGYYFRQRHETLLIGKRGNLRVPHAEARVPSVIRELRGRHSQKPEVMMEIIERMYPGLPKLELFARRNRPGWAAWGNEVVSDIELAVPAASAGGQLSVL
jgi:N6-adenosine-specific RNA methylase IME4